MVDLRAGTCGHCMTRRASSRCELLGIVNISRTPNIFSRASALFSSNAASTYVPAPLFRIFCPRLHTDVNQLLADTECGGPAVLRSFTSRKPFTNRYCSIFPLQPFFAGHSFFTLSLGRVSSSLATSHTRLPTAALAYNR
jgi:hypothetical protein